VRASTKKLENFSNRVLALREKLNLTQDALAKRLDVSMNYVHLIEKGRRPGKNFLNKLSQIEAESENAETEVNRVLAEGPAGSARSLTDDQLCENIVHFAMQLSGKSPTIQQGHLLLINSLVRELSSRLDRLKPGIYKTGQQKIQEEK
jgi:transcriptional regulator with XRE-family HTH domain